MLLTRYMSHKNYIEISQSSYMLALRIHPAMCKTLLFQSLIILCCTCKSLVTLQTDDVEIMVPMDENVPCIRGNNRIFLYKNNTEVPFNISQCPKDHWLPTNLTIGTIQSTPYMEFHDVVDNVVINASGYMKDVVDNLAQSMQFSYTMIDVKEYGKQTSPGNWTGGIDDLINKRIDILATDLSISPTRWLFIDYSAPVAADYRRLFLRKPKSEDSINWLVYWQPIHWKVYVTTIAMTIFLSLCLNTCIKQEFKIISKYNLCLPSLQSTFFEGLAIAVSQGISLKPIFLSGKIFIINASILAIIVVNCYNSQLISHMTVTKKQHTITIDEILQNPKFKIGWQSFSILQQEYMISKLAMKREIWERVQKYNTANIDTREALERFLHGDAAYLGREYSFVDFSGMCHYLATERIYGFNLHFGFPKRSMLTANCSKIIVSMREFGILKRINDHHKMRSELHCYKENIHDVSVHAVGINVFIGNLVPLLAGIPISLLVCILEVIIWKFKPSNKLNEVKDKKVFRPYTK